MLFSLFLLSPQFSSAANLGEACANDSDCTGTDCDEEPNWCYCSRDANICRETVWGGSDCNHDYECFSRSCISYPYATTSRQRCSCRDVDDCEYEDTVCESLRCLPPNNRGPGEPCTANTVCVSGECRSGTCTCNSDSQCDPFSCISGSCSSTVAASPITCTCCLKPDGTGFIGEIHDTGADASSCQIYCQREGFPSAASWGTQTFPCAAVMSDTGSVEWNSPLGSRVTPSQIIGKVIKTVLGVIGAIALLMFVYGGLAWMTSGGSPEKIKKAQATLIWAVLGMVVIFASYAAVDFVLKAFGV